MTAFNLSKTHALLRQIWSSKQTDFLFGAKMKRESGVGKGGGRGAGGSVVVVIFVRWRRTTNL